MSTWKRVVPEQSRKGDLIEHGSLECQEKIQYRWVNLNPKIDWVCVETTKYYKQKEQVSNDYGQTWSDVFPYQYQRGSVYEAQSTDCGYVPPTPQYRWVNMDISTDWICDGTTKYYKQKKQVSLDEGQTWQDVTPAEYQRGDVYETQSTDCGYVPPIYRWVNMDITTDWICEYVPETYKIHATYSGGQTYEKDCDGNTTLTTGDTRPSGYDRYAMTTAIIGNCVTSINAWAFFECSGLTSVTIPDSVISIGNRAFNGCSSLTSIAIPNSVTTIGNDTFGYCMGLTSVTIPNSVTSIDDYAFIGCSGLTSVTIPNSITSISDGTFRECTSLTSVTIPNSVTSIGNSAFGICRGLTSVIIPNSVTSIGYGAFDNCSGLTSVTIPNSVTTIGNEVFRDCSGLTSITVEATTPPTLGSYAFDRTNNCPIYVLANSVNAYKSASGWSTYASRIQAIP